MKYLICPLNWGLGHATRCVPIIRKLVDDGHEVVIVADGFPLEFLKLEFPFLRFKEYTSYSVYYSKKKSQVLAMIFNLPRIISGILKEHLWLRKLLRDEHFDQIISDNRFGMFNKKVHSVYMTHQIMVKMPQYLKLFEPIVWLIHRLIIHRFDECWIPDIKENGGLSGDLSHKYPLPKNAQFIGILSRFQGLENVEPNTDYEVVAVISGVEPQRTMFEKMLIKKYKNKPFQTILVSGQPHKLKIGKNIHNISLVSHLSDEEMAALFVGAKKIVSRSGYSTIMDLVTLNCLEKAELIATPGQTEQEYLFEIHSR
jgi:hypothetical protein